VESRNGVRVRTAEVEADGSPSTPSYGNPTKLSVLRAVARRLVPHLVEATLVPTIRTLFALASGSTFVYFMQPVLGKFALSGVFLLSVAQGRPLIGRFARDFCTMPADIEARAGIVRLYRHLTYLWAGVNLAAAAVSLLLLLTLPVTAFVAIKPFVGWLITSAGITLTVAASVQVARRECLLAAISPNGALSARCRLSP
jgi:hypothetical protein